MATDPLYLTSTNSASVRILDLHQDLESTKAINRKLIPYIHKRHNINTPPVATNPVTSSGVSAAYCVAAILTPDFHPLILLPAKIYSVRLLDACDLARNPTLML